jgi:iron complex transport system substrate-binding protein
MTVMTRLTSCLWDKRVFFYLRGAYNPKKYFKYGVVGVLMLAMLFPPACQPEFQPGEYTDALGRSVNIESVPRRIVSHVPSITEMLFALGLGDKVVGRSDYCDFPPEALLKPSVGDYFDPSLERIVAAEPDLVLTDGHSEGVKKLGDLGITFFTIDPKNTDEIFRDIAILGQMTGTESQAEAVTDRMRKEMAAVTEKVKDARKVRVFYAIDTSNPALPWTAGAGSFIDTFIRLSGGENIASGANGAWVQLSIEVVIAGNPEVIVMATKHGTIPTQVSDLKNNQAWQEMTAVQNNSIRIIDADLIDRSGPRITQGFRQLAVAIHPEAFQ